MQLVPYRVYAWFFWESDEGSRQELVNEVIVHDLDMAKIVEALDHFFMSSIEDWGAPLPHYANPIVLHRDGTDGEKILIFEHERFDRVAPQ